MLADWNTFVRLLTNKTHPVKLKHTHSFPSGVGGVGMAVTTTGRYATGLSPAVQASGPVRPIPRCAAGVGLHVTRGSSFGHPPSLWRLLRLGSSRLLHVTGVAAASAWRCRGARR